MYISSLVALNTHYCRALNTAWTRLFCYLQLDMGQSKSNFSSYSNHFL